MARQGDRPLSGVRVLDLSRVIAAPVAGRTLAAHGADVLLIYGPELPAIPWLTIDTGRGKLSSLHRAEERGGPGADARSAGAGRYLLARLSPAGDRRARLLAGRGREDQSGHRLCHAVRLWPCRPWAERRGFDLLVQTSTGFNHAEGAAAGVEGPKELPAQMLDHATGYLMAFGAMMAKARQAREGGSWHVRVSLAQTGRWLWNLGRVADGFKPAGLKDDAVAPFMEDCRPASVRCIR